MKRKKRKKKIRPGYILIPAVILVLAGAAVAFLFWKGVIGTKRAADTSQPDTSAAYLEYMNNYMLIDADGMVLEGRLEEPEGVPKITGISFGSLVVGQPLTVRDETAFAYVKTVLKALKQNEITVDEIYISSENECTVYVNQLTIKLGTDDHTEEKINDLRDFFSRVKDLNGTLDMTEYSDDNEGYSFRQNA